MNHLFPVVFVLVGILHLVSCLMKQPNMIRRSTKPMLMPLLAFCYFSLAKEVNPLILLALVLGCAGDSLLLFPRHNLCFMCGGISFCLGHVCYIAAFLLSAGKPYPPIILLLCIILLYCTAVFAVSYALRKYIPRQYSFLAPMYLGFVALMSICAFIRFYAQGENTILTWFGSILFLVSDSILLFAKFKLKERARNYVNFLVMLTYILAQALIVAGMC